MRQRTWKVLERGRVPEGARLTEYTCECGHDAMLPVLGVPLAQLGQGIVFDRGPYAMPEVVQCRNCRRVFATEATGAANGDGDDVR